MVTVSAARGPNAVSEPPVAVTHALAGSGYDDVLAPAVRVIVVEVDPGHVQPRGSAGPGPFTLRQPATAIRPPVLIRPQPCTDSVPCAYPRSRRPRPPVAPQPRPMPASASVPRASLSASWYAPRRPRRRLRPALLLPARADTCTVEAGKPRQFHALRSHLGFRLPTCWDRCYGVRGLLYYYDIYRWSRGWP